MSDEAPILGDPDKLAAMVEERKSRGPAEVPVIEPAAIPIADNNPFAGLPQAIERMRAAHPPKSDAEMREWQWKNEVLENVRATKLPPRFHYEVGHWSEPKQESTFRECQKLLQRNGAIVALIGTRGVGKTTIAAQLIIERAWNPALHPWERRPPYRKMSDLIAKYKPLYADFGGINTESLMASRDWYCRYVPFMVIDELHECDDQKFKDRVLTDILDRRYANKVDTLLISNQTVAEFRSTTNDSVLSRLSEHGRVFVCSWNSFRAGGSRA